MGHDLVSLQGATRSLIEAAVETHHADPKNVLSHRDYSLILFREAHPDLSFARVYESIPAESVPETDLTNISDEKFQPRIVFDPKSKEWQVWFDDGVTKQDSLGGGTQFRANLLTLVEGFRALDQDLSHFPQRDIEKLQALPVFYAIFKSVENDKGGLSQVIDTDESRTFLLNQSQYSNLHRQLEYFLNPPSLDGAKPQM